MITTGGYQLHARAAMSPAPAPVIARVTRDPTLHRAERGKHALLIASGEVSFSTEGFAAVLALEGQMPLNARGLWVSLPSDLGYLDEGDVVCVDPINQHVNL